MEDEKLFKAWQAQLEEVDPIEQMDCFRAIELNISNVCNLRCPFCPQAQGWKNTKIPYMTVETARVLEKQLREFNFKGYICIAGWGEPSLNPDIEEIIDIFKDFRPQLITNGIPLDKEVWERLTKKCQIKISIHDWDNVEYYKEKFKNTNAWFRNHDAKNPQMNLYNRAGYLNQPVEPITRQCYLMFYKTCIDVDGAYIQCEADWARKSETDKTIFNTSIKEYFTQTVNEKRKRMLMDGGRQNFECCKTCDIIGTLTGKKYVDFWRKNNENN